MMEWMFRSQQMIFGQLALISSSAFAAVALYVNVVQQPARLNSG
jgi:hypothetical protein